MKVKSATRIILWTFVAVVIAAGCLFIRNPRRETTARASAVARMKPVPGATPSGSEKTSTPAQQTSEADSDAAPVPATPEPPSSPLKLEGDSDATAFASAAESEVSRLHGGITLTQWLTERGEREGWKKIPQEPVTSTSLPGPECLSYWRTAKLPSGAEAVQAIYFYPPPAPSPATFPTLSGQELINGCLLTIVRQEAAPPTSDFGPALEREAQAKEFGTALDRELRQRFTKLYGESIGGKKDPVWGPGNILARDGARWIHGAEIVSGYSPQGSPFGGLVNGPAAYVRASLEMIGVKHDHSVIYGYRSIPKSQFHQAVALAKADAALSQRFQDLYERVFQAGTSEEQAKRPENANWRESFLPLLGEWLAALKTAQSAQRAAGLLAADHLLEAAQDAGEAPGWPEESPALQKLGAVFELNGIGNYYFYTGNWQKEARELDPDGPVGEMAVIGWMDRGSCDVAGYGSNLFYKIISDGEGLLKKNLDPPTAAQVHFMVGDAYSDVYTIARGYDPNGDFAVKEGEADPAHAKALEHYRAGLAIDNSSEDARHAWSQAWHLSAGLFPDMRYMCISD